jgi:hypothetical protein
VKGQTEPFIQGWYSADYGSKEPSTTAIFSAEIRASATFAWILLPAEGKVEKVRAQLKSEGDEAVRIRVMQEGKKSIEVTVPLAVGIPAIN